VLRLHRCTVATIIRATGLNLTFLLSLTYLTLSKACLQKSLQPTALSIFTSLKSLTLRDYINSCEFLDALQRLQNKLQLRLFKLCFDTLALNPNKADIGPVIAFLLSLQGLRYLYLKLTNFAQTYQIGSMIRHHSQTLETLMYHEKQLAPIDNRDYSRILEISIRHR
jgi:hypothetical protein